MHTFCLLRRDQLFCCYTQYLGVEQALKMQRFRFYHAKFLMIWNHYWNKLRRWKTCYTMSNFLRHRHHHSFIVYCSEGEDDRSSNESSLRKHGRNVRSQATVNIWHYCRLKAVQAFSLYCNQFGGPKINLLRITPANRNQSGPNSVQMNKSRGEYVQEMSDAIDPVGQMRGGGSDKFRAAGLFLSSRRDDNFSTVDFHRAQLATTRESMSPQNVSKRCSKFFRLRVICPKKTSNWRVSNRHRPKKGGTAKR